MAQNNCNRPRRGIIRSTAGIASLGGVSLFATDTGAAASGARGKYGYEITEDGDLAYNGDKSYMAAAVEEMNKKQDNGEVEFVVEDGAVVTQPTSQTQTGEAATLQAQSASGAISAMSCAGKNDHGSYFTAEGMRHKVWIDHCNCRDLVDLLSIGVQVSALAAAISGYVGNIPAAIASACAAAVMRIGKQLIQNNDEGEGIVVALTLSHFGGSLRGAGLEPQ